MDNPNIFAVLTPCDETNRAQTAFRLLENADRFHRASGGVAEKPTIDSREPTPALSSVPEGETKGERDALERIILTFDKPPKNPGRGWQFGTSRASDVLLGHRGTKGISGKQFHIIVDGKGWIFLYDDRSSHGTAVGYNGEKQDEVRKRRRGFSPTGRALARNGRM